MTEPEIVKQYFKHSNGLTTYTPDRMRTVEEFKAALQTNMDRLTNPPLSGYLHGGYEVMHLVGQHHPAVWGSAEEAEGFPIRTDSLDTEIHPTEPWYVDTEIAPSWEEVGTAIDALLYTYRCEGMTMGFVVVQREEGTFQFVDRPEGGW